MNGIELRFLREGAQVFCQTADNMWCQQRIEFTFLWSTTVTCHCANGLDLCDLRSDSQALSQ